MHRNLVTHLGCSLYNQARAPTLSMKTMLIVLIACTLAHADEPVVWQTTHYASGEVEWKTPFVNKREHGLQTRYRKDGRVERIVELSKGVKHGLERQFYPDGQLMLEMPFDQHRLTGSVKEFYPSGQLKREIPYLSGLRDGVLQVFAPEGELAHSTAWTKGSGIDFQVDDQGRLRERSVYTDGLMNGLHEVYDEAGQDTRRWVYRNGWRHEPGASEAHSYATMRVRTEDAHPDPAYAEAKAAWSQQRIQNGTCKNRGDALTLLAKGVLLDQVNAYLAGKTQPLPNRSLDIQDYYVILAMNAPGLRPGARRHLELLCDRRYNEKLPAYVSLDRPFDPWDYQFCGTPTENHLFNDVACRLAETIVFPDRVYSDGHTATEYQPYWEDAFRQLVASRIVHGMREWRSNVYCHVVFSDAMMIYHIMPDGPTREAARSFLDYLFLSIAISLRKQVWTGPHSRVYSGAHYGIFDPHLNAYRYLTECLYGTYFPGAIATSDYVIPRAIRNLPLREDRYVSIETVGPRFHPRGEGSNVFIPDKMNVYLCRADRENWGGDGILYQYLSADLTLGSMQDWGQHDGEWHMHCMPWNLMIASGDPTDLVFSFTGSFEQSTHQGGFGAWANDMNDQDATIFQHRKTLFCQIRAWQQEKVYEMVWEGFPGAPATQVAGYKRLLGYRTPPTPMHHRFYIADSLGTLHEEGGWIFVEKGAVYFAIRPVRGGYAPEPAPAWVPGQVFVCDIWDDVLVCETAHADAHTSFAAFRKNILATPLTWDTEQVSFTNLEGDGISFQWKEAGDPTVNGHVPSYSGDRYRDPCVQSKSNSGIITIECRGAKAIIQAIHP
ncbi:MAG: antitoxin component YwqK of YwqJK toxin-antitoxin module [Verrucomicrobiales bacterium]|jgi:antitoxin component YwqK of YwqJK toxin-antitoxin module